jgi:chromosome segregation ATPase
MSQNEDKMKEVQGAVDEAHSNVKKSFQKLEDRGERLENLDETAEQVADSAATFEKKAKQVKWTMRKKASNMPACVFFLVLNNLKNDIKYFCCKKI